MSASLEALHRVAREAGIIPVDPPAQVATEICREFHRLRGRVIALEDGLRRANHRLEILTPGDIP